MKDWTSPVYAFFDLIPKIIKEKGWCAHAFKCQGKGCKTTVRHYLDKGDKRSTGNMRKHVCLCWGDEVLRAADEAKDADEVCKKIVGSVLKGKGKVTYSHHQHIHAESKAEIICWVSENLRPFLIVEDRGFQSLMKTGQPEYYIPSALTVSQDIQLVFARTRKINFTTDGWTSPNHRALMAVLAHLEYKGEPLCLLLDIVEVPKVKCTYKH
ncbi:uncharacterized protein EDB91DRAFT_1235709 [Suillus paluster]|uniref:uncharacterized protein n=1 Tax=Suillus paluster TaxID=48578 RepID=UPI001B866A8E|nr:uncharacterized protein EDB91DRAFT_1235709 [Suillus paluster]KAG1748365.1 hypothetical protein EDB91DRAFT_1235709 [Suillus paluster]